MIKKKKNFWIQNEAKFIGFSLLKEIFDNWKTVSVFIVNIAAAVVITNVDSYCAAAAVTAVAIAVAADIDEDDDVDVYKWYIVMVFCGQINPINRWPAKKKKKKNSVVVKKKSNK